MIKTKCRDNGDHDHRGGRHESNGDFRCNDMPFCLWVRWCSLFGYPLHLAYI